MFDALFAVMVERNETITAAPASPAPIHNVQTLNAWSQGSEFHILYPVPDWLWAIPATLWALAIIGWIVWGFHLLRKRPPGEKAIGQ